MGEKKIGPDRWEGQDRVPFPLGSVGVVLGRAGHARRRVADLRRDYVKRSMSPPVGNRQGRH